MKFNKIHVLTYTLMMAIALSGCSVQMAASGKINPNLEAVQAGQDRQYVISQLGKPSKTTFEEAHIVDTFFIKKGYPVARYFRAAVYAFLDVGTFGLFELLGTPLEEFIQSKRSVTIKYDDNDMVAEILTAEQ